LGLFYRYHKKKEVFEQHKFTTDKEAVRYTALDDPWTKQHNENQFKLMLEGYSTRNKIFDKLSYIWTCYEWMYEDTFREVKRITEWLGVDGIDDDFIKIVVKRNSFKQKSQGREPGQEIRHDLWRRKGILGDWKNWFDDEMIAAISDIQFKYQDIISSENKHGNT